MCQDLNLDVFIFCTWRQISYFTKTKEFSISRIYYTIQIKGSAFFFYSTVSHILSYLAVKVNLEFPFSSFTFSENVHFFSNFFFGTVKIKNCWFFCFSIADDGSSLESFWPNTIITNSSSNHDVFNPNMLCSFCSYILQTLNFMLPPHSPTKTL